MKKTIFLASVCATFITACGGGGSPSTVSSGITRGVLAADGSAMSYGKVSIKSLVDSTVVMGTADINGNFQIPTSGITYPAIVRVQSLNGSKSNFAYIESASQINAPATPLTTLILAMASGGNPALITSAAQLTGTGIAAGKAAVNTIFSNVLQSFSVPSGTDLLTTNFETNHTGIDLILDALNIKFDAVGNPTVCTKILNACRTFDLANLNTTAISLSASEVSQLNSVPIASCSRVINSLTSTNITTDVSLYASDFLNSGLNAADYRAALGNRFSGISATFNNPIYVGNDANGNFIFQFDYYNTAENEYAGSVTIPFKVEGNNGKCVMAGDQLPFWIQVTSQVTQQVRVDGTNEAAVTLSAPVRGLLFRAGGDGFGGTGVQNTVRVGGNDVTINKIEFYRCDVNNLCASKLIEMIKGGSNNGYYYTPGGVNTIPFVRYPAAGINSAADFYNGNPNSMLVKMLDDNGTVQKTAYLKIRGGYISAADANAVNLPAVTNATAILSTQSTLTNPTLNLSIPAGTSIQGVSLASGMVNSQVTSTSKFVLSSTATSSQLTRTLNASTDYRSIQVNAATSGGTPISIKYVWSPTCTGCT